VTPPLRTLAGLLQQEPVAARPLALVGRRALVDALAARLLADGGERRALAPLDRPVVSELRRCCAVVACGLDLERARLVPRARRPWVAVAADGQDRFAVGALPFLGAENVVADVADVPFRLVRVLDAEEAAVLATRLPALRPLLTARLEDETARRAGITAALGRPSLLAVPVARAMMADAHAHGDEDPRRRAAAVAAAAVVGEAVERAGLGVLGRAIAGYGLGVAAVRGAHRMHGSRPGAPG
jgi:hypothetical protein